MLSIANETTFIDVAGKKTQLMRGGEGPPLLYLHSAGGETDWLPLHDALAERYTVYAPAHPGFALSEGLEQIEDIHDVAWHYVDLLEQLGLERVPIVGFSLGAWIALELALLRPQYVSKLALVAAAGLYVEGAPIGELFTDDLDELRAMCFYDPDSPLAREMIPQTTDDPRVLLWLRAREATARIGWNPYLHDPKLPAHLRRIGCPTLLVWGRHDKLVPLAHGEFYAEHIPGARLEVLEDCGHMVPLEKAKEFAALSLAFLA